MPAIACPALVAGCHALSAPHYFAGVFVWGGIVWTRSGPEEHGRRHVGDDPRRPRGRTTPWRCMAWLLGRALPGGDMCMDSGVEVHGFMSEELSGSMGHDLGTLNKIQLTNLWATAVGPLRPFMGTCRDSGLRMLNRTFHWTILGRQTWAL